MLPLNVLVAVAEVGLRLVPQAPYIRVAVAAAVVMRGYLRRRLRLVSQWLFRSAVVVMVGRPVQTVALVEVIPALVVFASLKVDRADCLAVILRLQLEVRVAWLVRVIGLHLDLMVVPAAMLPQLQSIFLSMVVVMVRLVAERRQTHRSVV